MNVSCGRPSPALVFTPLIVTPMRTYRIQGPDGQFSLAVSEEALALYVRQGLVHAQTLLQDCETGECFYAGQHPPLAMLFQPVGARPVAAGTAPRSSPWKVVAIVMGVILLLAAGIAIPVVMIGNSIRDIGRSVTRPKTLTSADGRSQVTVPWNWTEEVQRSNKDAVLQADASFADCSLVIITEARADFAYGLERYSEVTRKIILDSLKSSSARGPKKLTVGGHPALQYELHGLIDGTKSVTLHTCVQTGKNFHQIILATTPSHFAGGRAELDGIIASFRETGN